MRQPLLALALGLLSLPASAQENPLFGSGKPPVFREEQLDRRFQQTKLFKALNQGTDDPNCGQLIGGLLTLVAEAAPLLHKRDENFYIDPHLVQAMNTQLSTPRFPAQPFFVSMMRRILIDKKLPEAWMATGTQLAPYYAPMDASKLRLIAEGVQPVDSFLLTLPVLRERYAEEVERANATAAETAEAAFRDSYLDHEVAFGGLEFVDAKLVKPAKKPRKRKGEDPVIEDPYVEARLTFALPDKEAPMFESYVTQKTKKRPTVTVAARLLDKQYVDLARVTKGSRVLVRGRLWDFKKSVTEVEIRDALLFLDRDWSQGAGLADPRAVAACPLAVNDLTGVAPMQPGGFGKR
ncbi:hypothetical protein P2318_20900 [Myxococcaceae bacterium GXIMD 01537]